MTWAEDHPGGVITCDAPGCTRTRRAYCAPSEREQWEARDTGYRVTDLCPTHSDNPPPPEKD